MAHIVVEIFAAVTFGIFFCGAYLWYLTSGVEESEGISVEPRR
jgi:hypothetical protein